MKKLIITGLALIVSYCCIASGLNETDLKDIYHEEWIDLNKNGHKDRYEDRQLSIEERIDDLLSRMTLEEKTCQMCTLYGYQRVLSDALPTPEWKQKIWKDGMGAIDEHLNGFRQWGLPPQDNEYCWPASKHAWALNQVQRFFIEQTRLGIPVDFTNEGIRGIESYKATNFPTQLGIGSTWNRKLVHQVGDITGKEARLLGYTNVYAPVLDVGYDQRWGRYEEIYSESPFLCSELGVAMVRGLQKDYQVASTVKHFAVYSVNKGAREGFSRTDPKTSPREIENIFLAPFKAAFQDAGALGVMSSYNDYDGIPIQGSKYWLTDRLREDFGFKGYVVSDSDAVVYMYNKHMTVNNYSEAIQKAVEAGLNMRCTFRSPDSFILPLRKLVEQDQIPMKTIDSRVRDILRVKYLIGLFDRPYVDDVDEADRVVYCQQHRAIAKQVSRESIVLVKNQNDILPIDIKKVKHIAVCGPNADDDRYALTHYGPVAVDVTTVLEGIKNKAGDRVKVTYTKGADLVDKNWPVSEILPEPLTSEEQANIDKAVQNAQNADYAVVVVGGNVDTCGENKSRTSLDLPGKQLDLIKAVYETGTPTIVVLISGRPLSINWTDKYVPAILVAWYPGAEGGDAIADILFGDYNPSGKLPVTFPRTAGQIPMNFLTKPSAQSNGQARVNGFIYPFGHGLSYTQFEYSNIQISPEIQTPDENVKVSVDVTNAGNRAGDEIVQLYIRDVVSSVTTYEMNLRGFEKIHLIPGETKKVTFTLSPKHLALLNERMEWVVEPGEFKVMVGSSSKDIRQKGVFTIATVDTIEVIRETLRRSRRYEKYVASSHEEKQNPAVHIFDENLETRWASGKKNPSIEIELKQHSEPNKIGIAWYKGDSRQYDFEIQLSGGGGQWITVYQGKSSGESNEVEFYKISGFTASDLKIICHGNNENKWSGITEVVLPEFKGGS